MTEIFTREQVKNAINAGARAAFKTWQTGKTKEGQSFSRIAVYTFRTNENGELVPHLDDKGAIVPLSVYYAGQNDIKSKDAPQSYADRLLDFGFSPEELDPDKLTREQVETTYQSGVEFKAYVFPNGDSQPSYQKEQIIKGLSKSIEYTQEDFKALDSTSSEYNFSQIQISMRFAATQAFIGALGIKPQEIGLGDARQVG